MGSSAAACVEFIVEACIGVGAEDHVAGSVDDAIRRICGDVVKEVMDCCKSFFGGCSLAGTDGAECDKEFVVHGTSVVEEASHNGLDATNGREVKGGTVVDMNSLRFGTILDGAVLGRRV